MRDYLIIIPKYIYLGIVFLGFIFKFVFCRGRGKCAFAVAGGRILSWIGEIPEPGKVSPVASIILGFFKKTLESQVLKLYHNVLNNTYGQEE